MPAGGRRESDTRQRPLSGPRGAAPLVAPPGAGAGGAHLRGVVDDGDFREVAREHREVLHDNKERVWSVSTGGGTRRVQLVREGGGGTFT